MARSLFVALPCSVADLDRPGFGWDGHWIDLLHVHVTGVSRLRCNLTQALLKTGTFNEFRGYLILLVL